jgi:two-component system response regulator FixJ
MTDEHVVYVVDDDPGSLRSIVDILQRAGLAVRPFSAGADLLQHGTPTNRGCVVLDLRMPEIDGLALAERLTQQGCSLPVIIATGHGDVRTCARAFRMGVFDFLEKPLCEEELVDCVRRALATTVRSSASAIAKSLSQLTQRQREVLDMLTAGHTLKHIAAAHKVSVQSVWKQQQRIHKKLGVENHSQLMRLVLGAGQEQGRSGAAESGR